MAAEMKPVYLIAGDDEAKTNAALARLRARAERESGAGALEGFSSLDGEGPPDLDALITAIPAMSLTAARRYLLADRLERAGAKEVSALAAAVGALPPDLTVVLVERPRPDSRGGGGRARADARRALVAAIDAAGGELLAYDAPKLRDLPAHLVAEARTRGFALEPDAARLLVERMGEGTARLANELDRLAVWAGPGGSVAASDLVASVADTSEAVSWTLTDAIVERDAATALTASEQLAAQGEGVTALVWQVAKRLRAANRALSGLAAGRPRDAIERDLGMHPYAAKMLMRRLRGRTLDEVRASACAIADLEWWTRGGSDYPDDVALTLAVWRAAGGEG